MPEKTVNVNKPIPTTEVRTQPTFAVGERKVIMEKKISTKLLHDLEIGQNHAVLLAGKIRNIALKTTSLGECLCFSGDFRLVTTGAVYKSPTAYFPKYLEGILQNSFEEAKEAAEGNSASIQFAVKLFKKEDADPRNSRKFQWAIEEIAPASTVQEQENDMVLQLLAPKA